MFYNKNLLHSEIVTVPSDFRMLISQQISTTPVQPAESINTKTEVFFMRELRNTKIIAVDHGYGNMKTANTVTPTGIKAYETEPIFTGNILEYNGIYYRIGEGHKEFMHGIPATKVSINHFDLEYLQCFCKYLEEKRKNKPATINNRIAAIKSFMQWFLQHYGIVRPPTIHLIC